MIITGNRNIAMMMKIGENLTTRRCATAVVFTGTVFALKARLGLGGAICGWLLAVFGYVPNTVQTDHALFGIRMTASVFPAITFFIGVVALSFYGISKKLNLQIQDELAERRKTFEYSQMRSASRANRLLQIPFGGLAQQRTNKNKETLL